MSNKNKNLLGFPEVATLSSLDSEISMIHANDGYLSNADRRKMLAEAVRHKLAIDAFNAKTHYAMDKITEVDQYAIVKFNEAAYFITAERLKAHGMDCQQYIDEFAHHMIQVTAQNISGYAKICAKGIANEVVRSPYPPEPEEPKGFFARLLGR